jgi:hypothetical protein
MNNDINTISADKNAANLDLVGRYLTHLAKGGFIDQLTASALVLLLADCRVYSTFRDSDSLKDETSNNIRSLLAKVKEEQKREQDDISAAADDIINDLRKSGINI